MRLDRVHPRGGLVEQQERRLRRGGARDLQPAPVRVREAVCGLVPAVAYEALAEEREALRGEFPDLALFAAHSRRAQHRAEDARARVAVRGRHDVLDDAHVQEETQRLERPRDTALADLVRLEADEALSFQEDVAGVRPVDARDQVEERRLPRAVRPDDADDLAPIDVDVEVCDDGATAEVERDSLNLEELLGHQTISTLRSPSSPFGRTIISAMRMSPSTM